MKWCYKQVFKCLKNVHHATFSAQLLSLRATHIVHEQAHSLYLGFIELEAQENARV
jgi:hypothetical protein